MFTAIKISDLCMQKKTGTTLNIKDLPIDSIRPNPYQPRKYFEMTALEELSDSIKTYGVMQPINVRSLSGSTYELVAGERRLRAAKMAGLTTIPAIIIDISDNDSAMIAMVENLQRQNLNFIEEAEGYQSIMNDYGLTQEELAKKMGKKQSTIANKIRILKLPSEVKKLLIENNLTERHGRALLKIPDEDILLDTLLKIIEQELNVKKTEELVQQTVHKIRHDKLNIKDQKIKRNFKDIRLFTNTIKQSLDIMKQSGIDASYDFEEGEAEYQIVIKIPY